MRFSFFFNAVCGGVSLKKEKSSVTGADSVSGAENRRRFQSAGWIGFAGIVTGRETLGQVVYETVEKETFQIFP